MVFVVDSSSSVGRENFDKAVAYISGLVERLPVKSRSARVAVVTYSDRASVRWYLGTSPSRSDLLARLEHLKYIGGAANTGDALRVVREEVFSPFRGDRPKASNRAVLITDGPSNVRPRRTVPEAQQLRAAGVELLAIGVRWNETELDELRNIVENKDDLFLVDGGYEDLIEDRKLADSILSRLCGSGKPTKKKRKPRSVLDLGSTGIAI